ncbi:MAG: hypothetical protein QXW98_05150 [Candidatus Caldarchaeum sp.]
MIRIPFIAGDPPNHRKRHRSLTANGRNDAPPWRTYHQLYECLPEGYPSGRLPHNARQNRTEAMKKVSLEREKQEKEAREFLSKLAGFFSFTHKDTLFVAYPSTIPFWAIEKIARKMGLSVEVKHGMFRDDSGALITHALIVGRI